MNDHELARACHLDIAAAVTEMTQLAPGGAVRCHGGVVMCSAPSTVPLMVNFALRVCADAPAKGVLQALHEFFEQRRRGFTLLVHEADTDLMSAATEQGLLPVVERYPEMVCRTAPSMTTEAERVRDPEAAGQYWDICRAAYPSLGISAEAFDGFPESLLLEPHVGAFLSRDEDGAAVACAMTTLGHGIASIWWVASLPERRGRGYAAAATVAATRWAFSHGAAAVSLQASSMGEPLYRRLGYEDLGTYRLFLQPTAPAARQEEGR